MFSVMEYKERLIKTKKKMVDQGIDVLLVSNPSNIYYLTGYNAWSFYVPQMLVVILDEDQPIWIGRGMDARSVQKTAWLDEEHTISYTDDYVQSIEKHPMDFVAKILKEIGQSSRAIGIEMDSHYFSALCFEKLKSALSNAKFKNASSIVNWVRVIKSEQEIIYMKRAGKIVEKAMQAAYDTVNEGVRECDVAANIFHAQISGYESHGGDYTSIVPMLPTSSNTSCPHLTWTERPYRDGDYLTIEIAGCYRRYHTPMARTMVLGKAPEKVRTLSEVVLEGINETIRKIKPGLAAEEVEEVWSNTIMRYGHHKDSRLGYSIGLSYPPDWGEHTISLRKGDKTILQPNMTFHLMPGIWYEDYGVEITESIRVTESGCELLTNFPRKIFEKPIQRIILDENCS